MDILHFLAWLVAAGIGSFLGSYIKVKAKNLATKEDIGNITEIIEKIRSDYTQMLEDKKFENQLKSAVIEKRIQAHQDAYSLWWELLFDFDDEEIMYNKSDKCRKWWVENSLYLTSEARIAFAEAFTAAAIHPSLVKERKVDKKVVIENIEKINRVGKILVNAVALPSWGDGEYKLSEIQKAAT